MPYAEVSEYCGVEGQFYLTLHLVLGAGVAVMAVAACAVLVPIYLAGQSEIDAAMNAISMAHILYQNDLMAAVLVFFLLFSVFALCIVVAYVRYISMVYTAQAGESRTIDRYTVEIRKLPLFMPRDDLQAVITDLMNVSFIEHIQDIYVVPDYASAYRAFLKLKESKYQLKRYKKYFQTNSERFTVRLGLSWDKVDAIEHYRGQVEKYRGKVKELKNQGKNKCCGVAYVLCKSPLRAWEVVTYYKRYDELRDWKIGMAPAPGEINWENLAVHKPTFLGYRLLMLLFYLVFFFLLVTPVTMLQFLTYFFESIGVNTYIDIFFGQFLPPLILLLYLSVIVRHTTYFIAKQERHLTKSEDISSQLTMFMLVMVTYIFLVPLAGIQVASAFSDLFSADFGEWRESFANNAVFAGRFFTILMIHFTILKTSGDFLQFPRMFKVAFKRLQALSETEKLLAYEAYEFRWSYEYGVSITAFYIILAFSVAYPLILIVGVAFFYSRVMSR